MSEITAEYVRAGFAEAERLAARCKPELRDTFAYCYVRECFRGILGKVLARIYAGQARCTWCGTRHRV